MAPDAFQRKEGRMVPGGKTLKTVQGIHLPVLGADAVLHMGGQVIEIFLCPGIMAEQHIEVGIGLTHEITPILGCADQNRAIMRVYGKVIKNAMRI